MLHMNTLNILALLVLSTIPALATTDEQVLATVGDHAISDSDLASAMSSAPFATRFPGLDEETQAGLRGNMLLRLVNAELLRQEAQALGIPASEAYHHRIDEFRNSMTYKQYVDRLRSTVTIPGEIDRDLKDRYTGNPDALHAARSVYISKKYKQIRDDHFKALRSKYRVQIDDDALSHNISDDDIVAQGSFFKITYKDIALQRSANGNRQITQEHELLEDLIDIRLVAHDEGQPGELVEAETESFGNELLPQLLLDRKQKEWISDDSVLRDYYQTHPEISTVPERRHVAQIVLEDCEQAETIRQRLESGESMHRLASDHSIDEQGQKNAGDLGWLVKGRGHPALDSALSELAPGEISQPIKTSIGCHLVKLIERKPGRQRAYPEVIDAVRQALLSEKLAAYLNGLAEKYTVTWHLPSNTRTTSKDITVHHDEPGQ